MVFAFFSDDDGRRSEARVIRSPGGGRRCAELEARECVRVRPRGRVRRRLASRVRLCPGDSRASVRTSGCRGCQLGLDLQILSSFFEDALVEKYGLVSKRRRRTHAREPHHPFASYTPRLHFIVRTRRRSPRRCRHPRVQPDRARSPREEPRTRAAACSDGRFFDVRARRSPRREERLDFRVVPPTHPARARHRRRSRSSFRARASRRARVRLGG